MSWNEGNRVRLACGLVIWIEGEMRGGEVVRCTVGEDELARRDAPDCPSMHVPHHDGWFPITWLVPGEITGIGVTGPSQAVKVTDPTAPPGTPGASDSHCEVEFTIPG